MSATNVAGFSMPGLSAVLPTYISAKAKVGNAQGEGIFEDLLPSFDDVTIDINTSSLPILSGQSTPGVGVPDARA